MKQLLITLAAFALTACGSEGMQTERSSNGNEAKLIAIVKHCELWRVEDGSIRSVYMSICDGTTSSSTQHSETCGKSCTRTVQTVGTISKESAE